MDSDQLLLRVFFLQMAMIVTSQILQGHLRSRDLEKLSPTH